MPKGDGRSFTDSFLRNVGEGEYFDLKTQGLGIRVSPKGRKTWFFKYQSPGGKRRREKLGVYPGLTLGVARRRARIRLGEVSGETDRWSPRKDLLFEEAATEALDLMSTRTRERTIRERQRIYEKDLLPRWGDRLVSDIRRKDVSALVREIASRGSPVMANRTLSLVRALFNAMLDLELVEANPATRPARFYQDEGPRERNIERSELKAILKSLPEEGPEARAFTLLVIYTSQRAGAVAGARWAEFDLENGTWTIPPDEGKKFKKYARRIPLNSGAIQALQALGETRDHGTFLFPARNGLR